MNSTKDINYYPYTGDMVVRADECTFSSTNFMSADWNTTPAFLFSQNHQGVAGRWKSGCVSGACGTSGMYGVLSDQITGGQAASWARGGSGLCVYFDPSSATAGQTLDMEFLVPVTAATAFQLKFYVKTTQTSNGPTLKGTILNSNDDMTKLLDAENVVLTSASAWTLYTATSVTPTNTGFCRVLLQCLNGSSTGDVGVDDVSVA
jgi:hypothetical protein